jgi:hypothetical protein
MRPLKYSDTDRPVNVSLRIPRDLYNQVQARASMRRTTLTTLVLEGLQMALDAPIDPREIIASQDPAMQELEALIDARIRAMLAAEHGIPYGENITVMPQQSQHDSNAAIPKQQRERRAGRPRSPVGQQILTLLADHPEGLTAEQMRGYLTPDSPIGDTLSGMKKLGTVRTEGSGRAIRYFVR